MNLVETLRRELKGDVAADAKTLAEHATDASLFEVYPSLVVFPKDAQDVETLVRLVAEAKAAGLPGGLAGENVSLTARAAGTDMSGGPLSESIVVDFNKYCNHILSVAGRSAVVEPGVFYRDFAARVAEEGLLMPSYPASKDICAIGGMVANNAGGEKTLTYGQTADYVEAMDMVLRDGQTYSFRKLNLAELNAKEKLQTIEGDIYRRLYTLVVKNKELLAKAKPMVSKNSAGYALWDVFDEEAGTFDITRILSGSQGTLGLMTKIQLRLVKPRAHARLLIISLNDVSLLGKIVNQVLAFSPESFESYDDHTFKVALRRFPSLARRLPGSFWQNAWQFVPEFWLWLRGGIPKLMLLAEFTGDSVAEATAQAKLAQARLRAFPVLTKITQTEAEGAKYWTIRRESFNLLRHSQHNAHMAPFIDDFVVRPEKLPEFLPKLYALLNEFPITYTVAGHIGDGNFHIIPPLNLHTEEAKHILNELSAKVFALVLDYGGSISGEHNDGLVRSRYLKEQFGEEVVALFEETKLIFDPDNIFNPGKKVGGNWQFALDHLATHADST